MTIPDLEIFFWTIFEVSLITLLISLLIEKIIIKLNKQRITGGASKESPASQESSTQKLPERDTVKPQASPSKEYENRNAAKEPAKDAQIYVNEALSKERREEDKKRIGDILLEYKLITKEVLDKALEHQKRFGGNITQYLLQYGYIDEKELAHCLCSQFKVPYLPLESYDISDEIISYIPTDIAEKYWVVPVDKQGNSLMVVMIDPLDTRVIKELEQLTGLNIIPFVGIISEISSALQFYYKLFIRDKKLKEAKIPPFFIDTKTYKGIERRSSVRYKAKIGLSYPAQGHYKKSHTIDVCRGGFLFGSELSIPIGSIITLEFNLPQEIISLPISAITQVVRCVSRQDNKFEIAVKILKISKQEIDIILNYAVAHNEAGGAPL